MADLTQQGEERPADYSVEIQQDDQSKFLVHLDKYEGMASIVDAYNKAVRVLQY